MARKRECFTLEELVLIKNNGVKRFVRYDEGKMLYSMAGIDLLSWREMLMQPIDVEF